MILRAKRILMKLIDIYIYSILLLSFIAVYLWLMYKLLVRQCEDWCRRLHYVASSGWLIFLGMLLLSWRHTTSISGKFVCSLVPFGDEFPMRACIWYVFGHLSRGCTHALERTLWLNYSMASLRLFILWVVLGWRVLFIFKWYCFSLEIISILVY